MSSLLLPATTDIKTAAAKAEELTRSMIHNPLETIKNVYLIFGQNEECPSHATLV